MTNDTILDAANALVAAPLGPSLNRDAHIVLQAIVGLREDVRRAKAGERYTMAQDSDCHWYVIPVARQQEWNDWCDIPTDDERAWEPPAFAERTYGDYSLVTFTDPVIE